jgi:hypothetical protein
MHSPPPALMRALRLHVQQVAVELTVCGSPTLDMWLPQLRSCQLHLLTHDIVARVAARLGPALSQLQSLTLIDKRPGAVLRLQVLPGLQQLPQLATLVAVGSVPVQAWVCPHLTSLCCKMASIWLPGIDAVSCTALRKLRLENPVFPEGRLPRAICSASGLTSLAVIAPKHSNASHRLVLPAEFSQLRCVGRDYALRGRCRVRAVAVQGWWQVQCGCPTPLCMPVFRGMTRAFQNLQKAANLSFLARLLCSWVPPRLTPAGACASWPSSTACSAVRALLCYAH